MDRLQPAAGPRAVAVPPGGTALKKSFGKPINGTRALSRECLGKGAPPRFVRDDRRESRGGRAAKAGRGPLIARLMGLR